MAKVFPIGGNGTTDKQKSAVSFIESSLGIMFKGDINDFNSVSRFIGSYLKMAQRAHFTGNKW